MCNVGSFLFFVWLAYATSQSPQQRHVIALSLLGVTVIGSAICYLIIAFQRERQFADNTKRKTAGHPMPAQIKTLEEWTEAGKKLQEVTNRTFTHEEVALDGKCFTGCVFTHVNLFYSGVAPTALINCTFDADTKTHFHTRNPAIAQWTEMLRALGVLAPNLNFAITPLESKD